MKTLTKRKSTVRRNYNVPYPNAATKQQLIDQLVELLLTAAIGMGAAAIVLFLFTLA